MTIKTTIKTTDADTITITDGFDLFSMDMHGRWWEEALAMVRSFEARGGIPVGTDITELVEKVALGILHPDPGRVEILRARAQALRPKRRGLVKLGSITKDHLDAVDLVFGKYAIDAITASKSPFLGLGYEAAADLLCTRYKDAPWVYRFEWSRSYPRYIYRTSFIFNEGHAEALSYEYEPLYFRYSEVYGSYVSFDSDDEARALEVLAEHFADSDEECLVYLCDEAAYMHADDSAYNLLVSNFSSQDEDLAGDVYPYFTYQMDGSLELEDRRGLESFLADLPDDDGEDDPEDPYEGSTEERVRHALRWWL